MCGRKNAVIAPILRGAPLFLARTCQGARVNFGANPKGLDAHARCTALAGFKLLLHVYVSQAGPVLRRGRDQSETDLELDRKHTR